MNDLMVDIETLGLSKPAILSIAAVEFDIETGEPGMVFYRGVSLKSCIDIGLTVDAETFTWWLRQPDVSRDEVVKAISSGEPIAAVLKDLSDFISELGDVNVWSNGIGFDLRILSDAYRLCGLDIPWRYKNERDVRTLLSLAPVEECYWDKHIPVNDCIAQIHLCHKAYSKLCSMLR